MDAWENPIIETSEWNTFLALLNQGRPSSIPSLVSQSELPTKNIIVPFPDLVGSGHHGASSSNFRESFYPDCFLDTLEPMFQPESFERSSRAQGKLPMSDSYTQSEFPIDEVHHELTTKPIDSIEEGSLEFEKLVRDSWDFICNYDREQNQPFVKPGKRYKSLNQLSVIPEEIDVSTFPDAVCSCTGAPRKCYRGVDGGWTSSCCTAKFSQSPLPLYLVNGRKQRKVGRKMSSRTFRKVVERLYATGYNFQTPIDLKDFWAKLGTNQSEIKW